MRQEEVEAKEETVYEISHSFKYVINHANARFFFYVSC